jgi:hypothetical protein
MNAERLTPPGGLMAPSEKRRQEKKRKNTAFSYFLFPETIHIKKG